MSKQLAFAEFPLPERRRRKTDAQEIPSSAEVATVWKAEFLTPLAIGEYPNFSQIIQHRSSGQGVRFYDTMLYSDADLAGFFMDLADDVLHHEWRVVPASASTEHQEQARFLEFAIRHVPHHQNALRHMLSSCPRGYSVTERMYEVVARGEWTGAVVYADLLDKPQHWFTFDTDRRLRFRTLKDPMPGELVDSRKFVVVSFGSNSNPWGVPVLDFCFWPWFLKHHALKNEAIFFEKWAMPTAKAEYEWSRTEKINKENLDKALSVLQSIQVDQSVAVPKGIGVSLLESMRNGSISFEAYIDSLTEMESRIVTGQILMSMGDKGGSYAQAKVHEKRADNKVVMMGAFLSSQVSRQWGRDLIDRNYGPQDVYPTFQIMTKSLLEMQAEVEIEKALMANGHHLSRAWSEKKFLVVPPKDEADTLVFPENITPSQTLPVNPQLAKQTKGQIRLAAAELEELHEEALKKARKNHEKLEAIGRAAGSKAKPAIRKIVRGLASKIKGKSSLEAVTRAWLWKTVRGIPVAGLADVFEIMLDRPNRVDPEALANGEEKPPDSSDSSKIALALLVLAIVERILDAKAAAPGGISVEDFARSLSGPEGVGVDEAYINLFEGTHITNIASIQTAKLRRLLSKEDYRRRYPYVMIVVTNPKARLSHRMLDGFILTAEDARYSDLLPPFDFGCDCQAVPISVENARRLKLTGGSPVGSLDEFLKGRGAMPVSGPAGIGFGNWMTPQGERFQPGAARGFLPAYSGTDTYAQLSALRQKAEEIRRRDPEGWAALYNWLLWLFLYDILSKDPEPEEVHDDDQAA